MIIDWTDFIYEAKKLHILWVGETHGVANNYRAYRLLIKKLIPLGFNTVALEMPEDLEKFSRKNFLKYANYFDGRFSEDSFNFFEWLKSLKEIRVLCFDVRGPKTSQKEYEKRMAFNLLSKIRDGDKTLVVTGSFHSETVKQNGVLPMAGIAKEKLGEKLTVMEFKYRGGDFYNFGLRKFTKEFNHFDNENLSFGKISLNLTKKVSAKYFFHCSKAIPVRLLKATIKERLKDLYQKDQEDRKKWEWDNPSFLREVKRRDLDRHAETEWISSQIKKLDGESYYNLATIFQHGDTTSDYKKAHSFAKMSMDRGYNRAKWMFAATLDRFLVSQGKLQKYGTQYRRSKNGKYELFPLDSIVTDEQRKKLNVPSIEEMKQRIKKFNKDS